MIGAIEAQADAIGANQVMSFGLLSEESSSEFAELQELFCNALRQSIVLNMHMREVALIGSAYTRAIPSTLLVLAEVSNA